MNGTTDVFVRASSATSRVSVSSGGAEANNTSNLPALSGDGRFVVFESRATNLVAGDTNARLDVFRHDLVTGETVRANRDALDVLIQHLGGLTEEDVRRFSRMVIRDDGSITAADIAGVLKAKHETGKKVSAAEFVAQNALAPGTILGG